VFYVPQGLMRVIKLASALISVWAACFTTLGP